MATILITGGDGTLGRATRRALAERGDRVRILDLAPPDPGVDAADWIRGDIRDPADVARAMLGVDALIHAAAWHGIHLRDHSPADFWSLNVDGTFNVFEAAVAHGVSQAVVASTMGVYGTSRAPGPDGHAVRIHEDLPTRPVNVYELSKLVTEQIAASYDERLEGGVRSIALRFGMFVPEPFLHAGIRFLYGGIDERDVATAVIASLDRTAEATAGAFEALNVFSAMPYDEEDAVHLPVDPMSVVSRHWPDASVLLEGAGAQLWGPIREWYDIDRARQRLGWAPRYGFDSFLEALRDEHGAP